MFSISFVVIVRYSESVVAVAEPVVVALVLIAVAVVNATRMIV